MRIEPLEENQMSWMLKPLTWMMKRKVGKVLNPFKAWAYRPGITFADVDVPAVDRELEGHAAGAEADGVPARGADDRLRVLNRHQRCRWQRGRT